MKEQALHIVKTLQNAGFQGVAELFRVCPTCGKTIVYKNLCWRRTMQSQLSYAISIIQKLSENGFIAVFCGGYVRDMLLGIDSADIDIATDAAPDQIEALFDKTLSVGKAFGVIVVVLDGHEIEVATFRSDIGSSDGRHPDSVQFSSMEMDAQRRDITINGMFYDPIEERLIDYVGGKKDLEEGLIRLIGDPDARIQEDYLRMMRVIRFSVRLGFRIDSATLLAISRWASQILSVSKERVSEELLKILRTREYRRAMNLLFRTGLIDHILPEVRAMDGVEQPVDYHPEGDVLHHTIKALEMLPIGASDELMMGTLLHDVGKPSTKTIEDRVRFSRHEMKGAEMAASIMKRMRFSSEFSDRVVSLVENHMRFMHVGEMRIAKLKRFMAIPYFEKHLALHMADCLSSHGELDKYNFIREKMRSADGTPVIPVLPRRLLTGDDLKVMGMVPGPKFKQILDDVMDRQLEGVLSDREQALGYVQSTYMA